MNSKSKGTRLSHDQFEAVTASILKIYPNLNKACPVSEREFSLSMDLDLDDRLSRANIKAQYSADLGARNVGTVIFSLRLLTHDLLRLITNVLCTDIARRW